MIKTHPPLIYLPIFLTSYLLFFVSSANAQSAATTNMTVAPARQQHTLKPGESVTAIFKLYNNGDSPVVGTLSTANFIVTSADGKPVFLEGKLNLSEKYAAASWIKLPYDRLAIPAHEKIEIQVKITAPKSALPGGHYAAILFEPGVSTTGVAVADKAGQSAVAPRVAGLIYLIIPGDYEETALITDFSIPKFSQNGPIDIATSIKNTSPVHIRPTGTITITNMFGDILTNLPLDEVNIFPDATKNYTNTIPTKWLIGRFRADLTAAYGSTGKVLTRTVYFTVFPVLLAAYILVLLIALVLIIIFLNKRGKKHEQELEKEVEQLKKEVDTLEHRQ